MRVYTGSTVEPNVFLVGQPSGYPERDFVEIKVKKKQTQNLHTHIHTLIHTCMDAHTHAHIYTHTLTCIHTQSLL